MTTEKTGGDLKRFVLALPWRITRFFGRIVRRFFVAVGVIVALAALGYVEFESIFEWIDSRYAQQIDGYLGIDQYTIARLHDPAYFAQESVFVSEDQDRKSTRLNSSHTV